MSSSFNSPTHALNHLKKQGLVSHASDKIVNLAVDGRLRPYSEILLNDRAKEMLARYGWTLRKAPNPIAWAIPTIADVLHGAIRTTGSISRVSSVSTPVDESSAHSIYTYVPSPAPSFIRRFDGQVFAGSIANDACDQAANEAYIAADNEMVDEMSRRAAEAIEATTLAQFARNVSAGRTNRRPD